MPELETKEQIARRMGGAVRKPQPKPVEVELPIAKPEAPRRRVSSVSVGAIIMLVLAVLFWLGGIVTISGSRTVMQELGGMLLILNGTVLLAGALIVSEIRQSYR